MMLLPNGNPVKYQQWRNELQQELDNILKWWIINMVDNEEGGFYGRIDGEGRLHDMADKGIVLNTRILWAFSEAGILTGNNSYKAIADRAFDYMLNFFWDKTYGGMYWSLDYKGQPLDTHKQVYAQAFAIYVFSAYYSLSKKQEALDRAFEIFVLIENKSFDKVKGGYLTAFAQDWSGNGKIRLSEKDASEAKIMNTHLHILEAYTSLYKASRRIAVKERLAYLLQLFLEKFFQQKTGSLQIYFDENWQPSGNAISFGHDVEASWLLWEAAEILENRDLVKKTKDVCLHLAQSVYENGLDVDGAVFNEKHGDGQYDTNKDWWPQAEAVVGFWNAAQISKNDMYTEASEACWHFIKHKLLDKNKGEWYWGVDREGRPDLKNDKAGPWKSCYHNSRMCLEMIRRLPE